MGIYIRIFSSVTNELLMIVYNTNILTSSSPNKEGVSYVNAKEFRNACKHLLANAEPVGTVALVTEPDNLVITFIGERFTLRYRVATRPSKGSKLCSTALTLHEFRLLFENAPMRLHHFKLGSRRLEEGGSLVLLMLGGTGISGKALDEKDEERYSRLLGGCISPDYKVGEELSLFTKEYYARMCYVDQQYKRSKPRALRVNEKSVTAVSFRGVEGEIIQDPSEGRMPKKIHDLPWKLVKKLLRRLAFKCEGSIEVRRLGVAFISYKYSFFCYAADKTRRDSR